MEEIRSVRAKGAWQVTAGVIPGTVEDRFTRSWAYTSADYEADKKTCEKNAQALSEDADIVNEKELAESVEDTKFMIIRDKAFYYAKEVMCPNAVNWARVDFIWY